MKPYYEQDGITIYHGDCREIAPGLGRMGLVLADPPYAVGWDKRATWGSANCAPAKHYGKQTWDALPLDHATADMLRAISDAQIIWGANHFSDILPRSSCWLVWDKDNTGDYADCELAWTSFPRAVRKFKWRWNGMLQQDMANKEPREHPTQKPVPLMRWCLGFADGTVLDPYMGSGPTLQAARDLQRPAIGIEIEERYCEIAARRLDQGVLDFGVA